MLSDEEYLRAIKAAKNRLHDGVRREEENGVRRWGDGRDVAVRVVPARRGVHVRVAVAPDEDVVGGGLPGDDDKGRRKDKGRQTAKAGGEWVYHSGHGAFLLKGYRKMRHRRLYPCVSFRSRTAILIFARAFASSAALLSGAACSPRAENRGGPGEQERYRVACSPRAENRGRRPLAKMRMAGTSVSGSGNASWYAAIRPFPRPFLPIPLSRPPTHHPPYSPPSITDTFGIAQ